MVRYVTRLVKIALLPLKVLFGRRLRIRRMVRRALR